jgi:hypothetical protein
MLTVKIFASMKLICLQKMHIAPLLQAWTGIRKMKEDQKPTSGRAIGGEARAKSLSSERKSEIAKKAAISRWSTPRAEKPEKAPGIIPIDYISDDSATVNLGFDEVGQKIWATQQNIADIFAVSQSNVSRHISNIFAEGELLEESNMQKMHIASSDKPTTFYSLDVVISVGYRVNSKIATKFRQWANQILKAYLDQGYVINEKALRESPDKLNKLAAEVRALRSAEKQVYAKVRECFRISSSDYDPSSKDVRSFYALLQDKFHHAVTGMTSSKLIMDRADHHNENMGLQSMKGKNPTLEDAQTGKNYLHDNELYRLHLLSEQFLLYAESTALAGRRMTMKSLHAQLDKLLKLNDYPVFDGYKDYIRDEADRHAKIELGLYRKRLKIEALGIKYDEEALSLGEYDDILMNDA